MRLIDTHSHLFLEEFSEDLPQVIERARSAGVTHIFMPNIDSTTIDSMLSVCNTYNDYCFPMIGLHPTSVNADYEKELEIVARELRSFNKYIAIGEVGMDLYWDKTFLKEQQIVLDKQINWALEYDLPVVIHCRDAFGYIYNVLEPYKNTSLKGVFHSFTGTSEDAERLLEYESFMLGINGVVTFKKSTLSEVLKNVPLKRVVLETDSPYLAPVPYRGKRNESANLVKVAECLSVIYGVPLSEIASQTTENALKVFTNAEKSF